MFKKLILVATIITLCLTAQLSHASDKGTIKLVTPAYACALTTTNLTKAVLDRMGYDSEILVVSVATMWKALELGEADACVAAWLPATHASYYEKCKDSVENLGPNTLGARLGWVVPSYVDIDSITELNAHKEQFDNEIVGIAPSAGLMILSEKAMDAYKIDMELVPSSGAAMTAVLGDAIRQNKWIVVTGWSPHWKFGRWDLKYLDDPKGVLGGPEDIDTIVRADFRKDHPDVAAVLDRMQWDIADMQTVMAENEKDGADPYKNAQAFLDSHPKLLQKWLGK